MERAFLNDTLGYFDNENREYVIENMHPVRPLYNYLWSDNIVCSCSQFGFGVTFAGFNGYRRLMDVDERLVYIKDEETGEVYSPNRNYNNLPFDEFRCHVGIGYQRIVSSYQGLGAEFVLSAPPKDYAMQYAVKLQNKGKKAKKLTVFIAIKTYTNLSGHDSCGIGEKDEKYGGLTFPHNGFESPTEYGELYFAAENPFDSYAVVLRDIVGTYGSFSDPEYVKAGCLPCRGSTFENVYFAGVSYTIELAPKEERDFHFSLAIGKTMDEAAQTAIRHATKADMENSIREQKVSGESAFHTFTANIPDKYLQTLINIWLKRQVSLGKSWGRVYGKGFRDVMQDITAFVSFDVGKAKERILIALAHQYKNGNPIRMFDPDYTALYNDGATWIPDAITSYIKESGDYGILEEVVPYLDGGEDTVFHHLYQGMLYLTTDVGERGLTLFRRGDWNDSTNGAGNLGKGESVWTSLATVRALKQFALLLEKLGKKEMQADMLDRAENMTKNILAYGLYDGHFIHGYDDWGNLVGGGEKEVEASFCLNPQTWAVLADVGDKTLQNAIMDEVEARLKRPFGYVLNTPPYTKPQECVGRTSYFKPGVFENASVYIHGSMFKAVADCMLGRADNAYQTICSVVYRNNPNSGMEPYAISNMLIGPDSKYRAGEAPMSWVTGSAGWMYRALTEFVLGVQADYDGLRIQPNIPSGWDALSIERVHRKATYSLSYKRTGKFALLVDGKKIEGNVIPRIEEGERVEVTVYF